MLFRSFSAIPVVLACRLHVLYVCTTTVLAEYLNLKLLLGSTSGETNFGSLVICFSVSVCLLQCGRSLLALVTVCVGVL